ncbi:MAG: DIP1984 family protein [Acidimicrobiales bacterium]
MRLGEALAVRAALQKRCEQLRARAQACARFQEGEEPAENARALLEEAEEALTELEALFRRINRTNAATELQAGVTLTDAIARRDVLRLRHTLYNSVADAAAGRVGVGMGPGPPRQLRSELRHVAAVPVDELRRRADDTAREHRELDTRIQQRNWEVDLAE